MGTTGTDNRARSADAEQPVLPGISGMEGGEKSPMNKHPNDRGNLKPQTSNVFRGSFGLADIAVPLIPAFSPWRRRHYVRSWSSGADCAGVRAVRFYSLFLGSF